MGRRDGSPQPECLVVIERATLQGIALKQMTEGSLVLPEVGIGLAKGEMDLHLLVFRERAEVGREPLQGQEMRISRHELLRVREIEQHASGFWIDRECLEISFFRLVKPPKLFERIRDIIIGIAQVRLERDRFLEAGDGGLGLTLLEVNLTHDVERVRLVRLQAERAFAGGPRFVEHILLQIGAGEVGEGAVIAWIHRDRLLQQR
jgi:hypothetical protein